VAGGVELMYFFVGKYPFWDAAGCRRAFRVALCGGEDSLGVTEFLRDISMSSVVIMRWVG
jgi:hypothetical protein